VHYTESMQILLSAQKTISTFVPLKPKWKNWADISVRPKRNFNFPFSYY